MSSLKVVVFPGPEGVAYTTERKTAQPNPVIDFLSDQASIRTQEKMYTTEQMTNGQIEADRRKNTRNSRQLVCPPILDLAMNKSCYCEQHSVHKHRRIINGFFPSKIRTTSTNFGSMKDPKDPFEELVLDPSSLSYQNGVLLDRTRSKRSQKSEPANWSVSGQKKGHCGRRMVLSLRNDSPSPWIHRYQLEKKSISACNSGDLNTQSVPFERGLRGSSS